jgi:hypothetical protein
MSNLPAPSLRKRYRHDRLHYTQHSSTASSSTTCAAAKGSLARPHSPCSLWPPPLEIRPRPAIRRWATPGMSARHPSPSLHATLAAHLTKGRGPSWASPPPRRPRHRLSPAAPTFASYTGARAQKRKFLSLPSTTPARRSTAQCSGSAHEVDVAVESGSCADRLLLLEPPTRSYGPELLRHPEERPSRRPSEGSARANPT